MRPPPGRVIRGFTAAALCLRQQVEPGLVPGRLPFGELLQQAFAGGRHGLWNAGCEVPLNGVDLEPDTASTAQGEGVHADLRCLARAEGLQAKAFYADEFTL